MPRYCGNVARREYARGRGVILRNGGRHGANEDDAEEQQNRKRWHVIFIPPPPTSMMFPVYSIYTTEEHVGFCCLTPAAIGITHSKVCLYKSYYIYTFFSRCIFLGVPRGRMAIGVNSLHRVGIKAATAVLTSQSSTELQPVLTRYDINQHITYLISL